MKANEAVLRMRQVLRRQHKALATEDAYVHWLQRYIKSLQALPRDLSSEQKLEHFLAQLALRRHVAAATQNQAFNAIAFFYKDVLGTPLHDVVALRAKRPLHLRNAPTVMQTQALLQAVRNVAGYPTGLIVRLLYGCGLRLREPVNARLKDVDLERLRLTVREAKGGKDRVVPLPVSLIPAIQRQCGIATVTAQQDAREGIPLSLPGNLARKYPACQFAVPWAWLFPAHRPCRDPRSGRLVRYHLHEVNVQRAVKDACRKLGFFVQPHELRHAYATHCLEGGTNPRAIQAAMGHKSLETTMGYLHAEALSVVSPLDSTLAASGQLPVTPAMSR